ncbi:MAG TPA: ATP-dependent DNA helicase RecG [Mycobacteriales bacterium]|nr:ATP-dependent DNA helicase RecG [Mycobacteriales bacterium]
MVDGSTPLKTVVGGKTAAALAKAFDYATVGDLLHHYPRRYFERGELTDLAELKVGDQVTIQAKVVKVSGVKIREKLHKTDVTVTDGTGRLVVTFFNRRYLDHTLLEGMEIVVAGEVERFKSRLQLKQPDIAVEGDRLLAEAGALMPVYPATKALPTWSIRRAVRTALDVADLPETLPDPLRRDRGLIGVDQALQWIHRPESWKQIQQARDRLKYDEAFVLQVVLAQRRSRIDLEPATPRAPRAGGLLEAFDAQLPFTLTAGQVTVSEDVMADLAGTRPMHRLLQGEVGSGKTVVALRAMLAVVDAGGQAVLLAPTEVLAQQHARSIDALLGPLGRQGELGAADVATRVALVTGSMSAQARRQALLDIASGDAGIVVGTHALLEERVQFFDLGLVVVDEQHRFGVEQRDALRGKGTTPPHVLVMTATPIPRTVAMTVYGDLETSTLTELPQGRQPIATTVVPTADKPGWLDRVWARAREEVDAGRQIYVVCPRIDADNGEDDAGDADAPEAPEGGWRAAAAVEDWAPRLAAGALAGLRVEILHGRLASDAKDDVMRRFAAGHVDVLVATTVIEVGVDVANATAMVVLDADRFGISQLHQLRGRIGRGAHPGVCLLVTGAEAGTAARERLDGVAATLDGFALARLDLEQRREGDVLGESQSGRRSHLKLLRLLRDEDVIASARADATELVAADPDLAGHPALAAAAAALVEAERADYLEKT